jgi:riboflavin kinase/FMN adenylyltransferase
VNVISQPSELQTAGAPVCLALGMFDGVHLGHQQVILRTVADARQHQALPVVVTFDRHPNAVVAPDRTPPLIHTLPQRLRALEALGAEVVWLIRFDRAFSEQTGEAFVQRLARDFRPLRSIAVGVEFTFGHRRGGNAELLRLLGERLGFTTHALAPVTWAGKPVSSTRIREAIQAGDLDEASQMLGRRYALAGRVLRGDRLGARLGFPTANLQTNGLVLPPSGVYIARALVRGSPYPAVMNIGYRPTLVEGDSQLRVEAHLLDFSGDLYDKELELSLLRSLRAELRFPSISALQEQIGRDIAAAREHFRAVGG